jgi:hypothetical protein
MGTTANFDIPFLDGTELVRDYPQFSEDLAEAIDDGLGVAGGLVAVRHVIKTNTETQSLTAGANFAVDGLSITHTMADASNRLIISAYFGAAANSQGFGQVGIAVADDGTLVGVGDAVGNRARVGAGGPTTPTVGENVVTSPAVTFLYEPGDTAEHVYTVRAINIRNDTRTVFINRSEVDTNDERFVRATSGFVIQEVKV